jgi:hypothetical protein
LPKIGRCVSFSYLIATNTGVATLCDNNTIVFWTVPLSLHSNCSCIWSLKHNCVNFTVPLFRSRSRMESVYFINLIFIFAVSVFFFFSGICLNSLVILSFWRSIQLRKKSCYFMIMVLSCCDLLAVITNSPLMALQVMIWLSGKLDVNGKWAHIYLRSTTIFLVFSLFALLVMNFDRYLATSYPIFHRTSVTKGRLLTLLAILNIVEVILKVMSVNDFLISNQVHGVIFFILFILPMLFINYKLLLVVRKSRKNKSMSPDRYKKNIFYETYF